MSNEQLTGSRIFIMTGYANNDAAGRVVSSLKLLIRSG